MTLKTAFRVLASLATVAVAVAISEPPQPSAQTSSVRQAKLVIAVQPMAMPEQLTTDAKELREFLSKRLTSLIAPPVPCGLA